MLATRNESWGFYGTLRQSIGDEDGGGFIQVIWNDTMELLMAVHKLTEEQARDFLDSVHGRHLADSLNFDLEADDIFPAWIPGSIKRFLKTYDPADFTESLASV